MDSMGTNKDGSSSLFSSLFMVVDVVMGISSKQCKKKSSSASESLEDVLEEEAVSNSTSRSKVSISNGVSSSEMPRWISGGEFGERVVEENIIDERPTRIFSLEGSVKKNNKQLKILFLSILDFHHILFI